MNSTNSSIKPISYPQQTMNEDKIQHIAIIGGGSAGWISAAALVNALKNSCKITLVESENIGIVGVGEATIPAIKHFNQQLGIAESDFLKHTQGTFKLGIQFIDWKQKGHNYFHPFGQFGAEFDPAPFYQYWLKSKKMGSNVSLYEYSIDWIAAINGKFDHPKKDPQLAQSTLDYAYHLDAVAYGQYLRGYSEHFGVQRIVGDVTAVNLRGEDGYIKSVSLADGQEIAADLFIDCTGFKALLIEGALKTGYVNWNHWLPCDSAVAVPSEMAGEFTPYTKATAREAGWQWRIPLQHRIGNGYVYSSNHTSKDQATETLLNNLDGSPIAGPRHFRFTAGHRREFWHRNCISIGLASGFLEPLESTSIHLIQTGIMRLIALFPDKHIDPLTRDEYNRITRIEYELIRDFLILHYCETSRDDTDLWRYCATMPIPEPLADRIERFRRNGFLNADTNTFELFKNPSWLAVLIGQGVIPDDYAPIIDHRVTIDAPSILSKVRHTIKQEVDAMPTHQQFIDQYCKAPKNP